MSDFSKPYNVKYKPGRIQTLEPEQEVVLKQTWAYLLKYWGYDLAIPNEDLPFKESFVPSSFSNGQVLSASALARSTTRSSVTSLKTTSSIKKKGGLFGSKSKQSHIAPTPPENSKRMKQIQSQSSLNKYEPVTRASESTRSIFLHYYKEAFQYSKYYVPAEDAADDNSDLASIDSFVTASTSFSDLDTSSSDPTLVSKSNQNATDSKSKNGGSPISVPNVKPNTSILSSLSKFKPVDLHNSTVAGSRHLLLDNIILRFVRARKFVSEDAVAMAANSMNWRLHQFPIESWVNEGDAKSYLTGKNKGFIKSFTTEKSAVRGEDVNRFPIFYFQARKHFSSDSPLPETQRFAILTIESTRFCFREVSDSIDQATIVFDLTGFGLKNADNSTIKFLAEAFEAHYPESLGSILIHNAPWIFSQIWNVIKNWLDPVVASKIHFTKNIKEISKFIDPKYLPKEIGGSDEHKISYPKPSEADLNPPKKRDATFRKLMLERDEMLTIFFELTIKWVEATNPEVSAKYLRDKIDISTKLAQNYIDIDPYIRSPSLYDRNGTINMKI